VLVIVEVLFVFGIVCIGYFGFEVDDVIGILVECVVLVGMFVDVVIGDCDLF